MSCELSNLRDCLLLRESPLTSLSVLEAYLSLQEVYQSVQEVYLSLQEAYLPKQEACLSVQEAYLSGQEAYVASPNYWVTEEVEFFLYEDWAAFAAALKLMINAV